MIGKLLVALLVLGGLGYGVMWVLGTFSMLQIVTWIFIGMATFIIFWLMAALFSGAKTNG